MMIKKNINNNDKNKINNNILNKLKGKDEIPFRVEADLSLKNRKIVSQYDYSCTLSPKDLLRISHTSENNDQNEKEEILNNSQKNTNNNRIKTPIINIKKKLSTIKSNIIKPYKSCFYTKI